MSWLKSAINDEKEALGELLDMAKQKLIEAGTELLRDAENTVDGITITCTFTATVSKRQK